MATKPKPAKPKRNGRIDEASDASFPASDPPSYARGGARIGAPASKAPRPKRKQKQKRK